MVMVELSANASPSSAFIRFSEVKIDFEWSRTFSSRGEASYEVRDGRIWQMGNKKGLFAVQAGGNLFEICTATMAPPRPAFPLLKNTACFAKGRFLANRLPRI
jgi:hypothetical protein